MIGSAVRDPIKGLGADISGYYPVLDVNRPQTLLCRAWALRGACVSIGYDVNTIIIAKVTYGVFTFSGHVVVYVGFAFEDHSCINEED